MRTTIDIPDELFRQVKARAAMRGLKLKEYIALALRDSLFERADLAQVREASVEYGEDVLVLRDDCVIPLITGATGPEMRSISGERIDEILGDEDAEDALPSGGR